MCEKKEGKKINWRQIGEVTGRTIVAGCTIATTVMVTALIRRD
jgi:hypothetical protein